MKYKFLRISLLSALAVLFGGTALGAFMAAAEADGQDSGGETATVSWAVEERPLCATPFSVKNGDAEVLQIAFGSMNSSKADADSTRWNTDNANVNVAYGETTFAFKTYATTKETNGSGAADLAADGSSQANYVAFVPKYDGTLIIVVQNNGGKTTCLYEDGVQKAATLIGSGDKEIEFNGSEDLKPLNDNANYSGGISVDVTAGKLYTISVNGSKGRWGGVIYNYVVPADVEDPEDEEPQEGDMDAVVKMTYINGTDSEVDTSYGEIAEGEPAYTGYNKISAGKVELGTQSWGVNNVAYLQVDASAVPGTVQKAVLKFKGETLAARNLVYGAGYNGSEWSSSLTWNTADRSITTVGSEVTVAKVNGEADVEIDITNALVGDADKIVTVIVYQTAAGGGYVKSPTVTVSYTTAKTYAVTFAETNGVKATVTVNGRDVTNGTSLPKGEYEFTATAVGYKDYTGSFTVDGADKVVEFTMTEKAFYNYTVKGVGSDGTDFGVVSKGIGYENENVTYYYPEFVLSGKTLYKKNQNGSNPYWGATGALDADNKEFTITYSDGTVEDVIFYKEAEDMKGFTAKTTNNATIRCSNGTGGIVADTVKLVTLTAGKYKIFGQVWGTNGLTAGVKTADADVWTLASTGSLVSDTSAEFELADTTALYVYTSGGNDNHMLDLIYIISEDGAVVEEAEEPVATTRRWDFTKWSDATVANLIADAAASKVEGWSDVEKEADAAADADPTETSKDNCFWAASSMTADEIYGLSANGIVIDELKGLKFTGALNSRNLAIAVNYPVALSTYEGGSYLWLGGKNKKFITIPAVAGGSTIKMGVESHNTGDARGVDLLVNGESIGQFTPTVYEEHEWTVTGDEAVDVVVDNTNGCHIYFIEVEQDQEALLAVATADLETVIAAAEAIEDLSIYTEESAEAFNAALTAAKAAEATVEAQTEAAYVLLDAKAALQKSEPDPDPVMMTYTVNEVAGDIVFRATEGEALEGTDVKVPYRLYNVDENGQLYTKAKGLSKNNEFNYIFKLETEGQVENIEYSATDVENVVFLSEGEDIEGLTPVVGNADVRSSNSAAAYPAEDTEIVTLEAGTYVIVAVIHDARKDADTGKTESDWTFKAGEQEITLHCGTINFDEVSSEEFTLNAATTIILAQNETNGKAGLDVMYIVKTGDVVVDGINAINAEAENGAIYNLQGQKVQKAQKGLYIINGKKVVK